MSPDASHALAPELLATRIASLPALPSVATSLLRGFDEPDADLAELARQIAADQALAARALRISNSPFYGQRGRIDSIREAVVVLGFRAVRSMVVSAAVVRSLSAVGALQDFDGRAFWRHGVGSAVAARQLALLCGHNPESAFTAGLLHDVGQLVLAVTCPQHCAAVQAWRSAHGDAQTAAEQHVLGLTHAEAGAMLAAHWGLPARICAAIALHHSSLAAAHPLAALVHVGDVLAHGLGLASGEDEAVPPLDDAVWDALALDSAQLSGTLGRIETEFEDTLDALID